MDDSSRKAIAAQKQQQHQHHQEDEEEEEEEENIKKWLPPSEKICFSFNCYKITKNTVALCYLYRD